MLGYSTWAFGVQRCCLVTQRYYKSPLFLLIFFGEGIVNLLGSSARCAGATS
jgi:hypothetical protein